MYIFDKYLIAILQFYMKKIRVILSTFGPLHLIKSAEALCPYVDMKVIQGWIPKWWNRWLLKPISFIVGYDLGKTIKKRTPVCLCGRNIGIGLPEFLDYLFRICCSKRIYDYFKCVVFNLYGFLSTMYINNAEIFHVRSGSGRGGTIKKAHKNKIRIVVDHSIAHPAVMEDILKPEYRRLNLPFDLGISSRSWQLILQDCLEADALLVNSDFVKSTFVDNGFNPDKIYVVYLGVRNDFIKLKTNYQIQEDGILRILFTGGFSIRKGAEYILSALKKLDIMGIKYDFTVVGNYSEALKLLDCFKPLGLRLIGFVPQDDLKQYLRDSDIYLFPSLCEGCASSAMEALAAGLPVISTRESGLPIKQRINGILIESKNADNIVSAILELKSNSMLREQLGNNAANMIKTDYNWDSYAKKVLAVYHKLLVES